MIITEDQFSGFSLKLLISEYEKKNIAPSKRTYSDLMKQFSLTLFFYSLKAYKFVRSHFFLPHS